MKAWAERLRPLGEVVSFDYPYMKAGRRSPDRLSVLVSAHREALRAARAPGRAVVLVGKSMGGRIGCHVALEEAVAGLVCLGYPLRGARGDLRDAVLLALSVPVLFVQGARDALCPLASLEAVRERMRSRTALHVVEGGNHSLEVGARTLRERGETQAQVDTRAFAAIRQFVSELRDTG